MKEIKINPHLGAERATLMTIKELSEEVAKLKVNDELSVALDVRDEDTDTPDISDWAMIKRMNLADKDFYLIGGYGGSFLTLNPDTKPDGTPVAEYICVELVYTIDTLSGYSDENTIVAVDFGKNNKH